MSNSPVLYVVATPIGNLSDITLRALEVLRSVDVVAAEDTRMTQRLLTHFGIDKRLVSLHEHNEQKRAAHIVNALAAGKSIALVSDAGTPAISDPGAQVVDAVRTAGYGVVPIPGPNAAVAALSVAGIKAEPFLFWGFLPTRASARRSALEALQDMPYPLVFYEAPHRVVESVQDLSAVLGAARRITIARELTKVFESVRTCTLGEAAAWFAQDAHRQRGEFVLIVSGAIAAPHNEPDLGPVLAPLLKELPLKQAVKLAVAITGAAKNQVYQLALSMKGERGAKD